MAGRYLLTDRGVQKARHNPKHKSATMLKDGGSLYLRIRENGGKAWIFRYRDRKERGGKVREMGLGGYPEVGLADARRKAEEARQEHKSGVDVLGKLHQEQARQRGIPSFSEAIANYLEWRKLEGTSAVEWETTLRLHTAKLHSMRVDFITPEDVAAAMREVWKTNRSARRILNRVEQIFERCIALRYCTDNPARWSIQQHLLGPVGDTSRTGAGSGHKSLPWQEIPAFMQRLRDEPGQLARVLELIILTASRIGEVAGDGRRGKPSMGISEINGDLWTIPAERMKTGVEHRVPLSDRALEIAGDVAGCPRAYPGIFEPLLKKLGADCTVHGMRATFKSWAEENGYGADPRLVEFALAHKLPDKVEASYNRVTRVEERRALMQRWADYCAGQDQDARVVPLKRA